MPNTRWLLAVSSWLLPVEGLALDLWVDHESRGGQCGNGRAREEVGPQTPWCTLAVAASLVQPGDTVHVRQGLYTEVHSCPACDGDAVLQIVTSGTQDDWIRFVAAPGEVPRITGASGATTGIRVSRTLDGTVVPRFVEISGLAVAGVPDVGVAVADTSDVVLSGLDVAACGAGAVELHRTARVTIEGSQVHENALVATSAIHFVECLDGNVVRGTRVWGNTDDDPGDAAGHGLAVEGCGASGGVLVENDVIWGNEGWCIWVDDSDGAVIRNDTCWQNGLREGAGELAVLGEHHRIHNDVLVAADGRLALAIRDREGAPIDPSTIEEDANVLWSPAHEDVVGWLGDVGDVAAYQAGNPGGWGARSIQEDPTLADTLTLDYRLTPGSPAVDSGDPTNAAEIDADGVARPIDGDGDGTPIVDRGAYELAVQAGADAGAGVDAGAAADTGVDAGTGGGEEGCGCRSAGGQGWPDWIALGAGALMMRHVRRRSRDRAPAG